MKHKILTILISHLLSVSCYVGHAQGTAFSYQGRLNDGANVANGAYDLRFAIYNAGTAGTQQGTLLTNSNTAVSNGLFTVTLDFGNQFPGANRWLEIGVRTNGTASFFTLSPRQTLTPTPYAITAGSVVSGGLTAGTYGNAVTLNNGANSFAGTFTGNGGNVTNVSAATLGGFTSAGFWKTNGNAGANPTNGAFIGNADNLPLEFKVNNQRALRLQYGTDPVYGGDAPTLIAGSSANTQSNTVFGAVIIGGGNPSLPNVVGGNYSAVLGGMGNVASGNYSTAFGYINSARGQASTALGSSTTATGGSATAMGNGTLASGDQSTAMGESTTASAAYSVAMGNQSTASGQSAVAMGANNTASGFASFAAGRQAKALTQGTFVWADSQGVDFSSIANDQFLIRAVGGVGIGTNYPQAALHVVGNIIASGTINGGFTGNGENVTNVNAATLSGVTSAGFWKTNGNAGADPANGTYLGTSDNLPVELRVNGQRALRLEPGVVSPNVLGGYSGNLMNAGVIGGFIGGGGNASQPNRISGNYASIPGGLDNVASGYAATALGRSTVASGSNSVAMGLASSASGLTATALGTSSASGNNSIAMGLQAVASGVSSVAIGNLTKASGAYSVAMGAGTSATNDYSTAFGKGSLASGVNSLAGGLNTVASGFTATATGTGTTASGNYSTAMGQGSVASGLDSVSAGLNNIASGINSVAMGESCIASNLAATALGYHTVAGAAGATAIGVGSQALHDNTFVWSDGSPASPLASTRANQFAICASGGILFFSSGAGTSGVQVQPGGGSWSSLSDRNAKTNLTVVDTRALLEKLIRLPVATWNYKTQADSIHHIGPMAQDFAAAFGVGEDNKHITSVDADGVALAAIQGLNQKLEEKETEIIELKRSLADLKKVVQTLVERK